jgi:Tfp pilus assembly protein PilE
MTMIRLMLVLLAVIAVIATSIWYESFSDLNPKVRSAHALERIEQQLKHQPFSTPTTP